MRICIRLRMLILGHVAEAAIYADGRRLQHSSSESVDEEATLPSSRQEGLSLNSKTCVYFLYLCSYGEVR